MRGPVGFRTAVALLVAALTLAVAGTATAVVRSRHEADVPAATVLERAQRFIRAAPSVRFKGQATLKATPTTTGGNGQVRTFSSHKSIEGVAVDDRLRATTSSEQGVIEMILLRDTLFSRQAEKKSELVGQKWSKEDLASTDRRNGVVRPSTPGQVEAAESHGITGLPTLKKVVAGASVPRILRRSGNLTVVAASVPLNRLGDLGQNSTGLDVEITADRAGRVGRMVVTVRGRLGGRGEAVTRTDYQLSAWGDVAPVEAPPATDIDPTPGIDEDEVAAFDAVGRLQPHGIPEGWTLDQATVLAPDETAEGCEQLEIHYARPDDSEGGYIDLFEFPAPCADPDPPPGARPFVPAVGGGWVLSGADGTSAQILVGGTVVQAQTDLSAEELTLVLAGLDPLDLAKPPAPIAGIGRPHAPA